MDNSSLHLLVASMVVKSSETNSPVTFPGGGALLWWWICSRRKEQEIGGWLLFYFWQVFSGVVLSTALTVFMYRNFVPENFGKGDTYAWMLLSTLPGLVLFLVHAAVAVLLLCVRTWDMLVLLRAVATAQTGFLWLGIAIDAYKFPDGLGLDLFGAVPMTLWVVYLFRSERVTRVFKLHNWGKSETLSSAASTS